MRWLALIVLIAGCNAETLPADYAVSDNCFRMNPETIEPTDDDPHEGFKNVYACDVQPESLLGSAGPIFPYPDGTRIIKISTREDQPYPWLVATAEKKDGAWEWKEFTRNFQNEEFALLPVSQDVCVNCHKKVEATDFLYTVYAGPVSE